MTLKMSKVFQISESWCRRWTSFSSESFFFLLFRSAMCIFRLYLSLKAMLDHRFKFPRMNQLRCQQKWAVGDGYQTIEIIRIPHYSPGCWNTKEVWYCICYLFLRKGYVCWCWGAEGCGYDIWCVCFGVCFVPHPQCWFHGVEWIVIFFKII